MVLLKEILTVITSLVIIRYTLLKCEELKLKNKLKQLEIKNKRRGK